ncbi:MAG: sodium:calcium antiporter [Gemmatimonadota bacterium]|nr:MAG: sodium:calcium antiporter [Gemmatimonadota bacterium]
MTYIQLFGGLIYLLMGGDLLVRGAVALARRFRVSPLVVALTLVAFGTSLPELVVTVQAALAGYPGMAIGNVVGSNIANIFLVGGAPAIVYPLACGQGSARRDSALLVGVSLFFVLLCLVGDLNRAAGALLLAGLAVVAVYTAREIARAHRVGPRAAPLEWVLGLPTKAWMIALFVVAGAVGLPVGARLMVEAAVEVANQLGVSDTVVGLTIVAVGTSLPELATTLVAAIQRQTEVAVGTVIGSSVFNVLGIMGIAAVVSASPIPVPPGFLSLDLPVMLGAALVLTFLVWRRRSIGRSAGILLMMGYGAYLVALFSNA